MPFIDDEPPRRKIAHTLGEDVSLVSEGELGERIDLLKAEIDRLEAEVAKRRASRAAAASVFRL